MAYEIYKRHFLTACIPMLLIACGENHTSSEYAARKAATFELPIIEIKEEQIPVYYHAPGAIISDRRIDISSRITSFIKVIHVLEGEHVVTGQLIASLDSSEVDGSISRLNATLAKARADLADARVDVEQYQQLHTQGSVSNSEMRKVILSRDMAVNTLNEAIGALSTAESQLLYTKITSPDNGVVIAKRQQRGDLATPGQIILSIESDQQLLFDTFLPAKLIGSVRKGDAVAVDIDTFGRSEGVIARIIPSGDPITRRYQVKIQLYQAQDLLPGMFGRASFELGTAPGIVIPQESVVQIGGVDGVYALDEATNTIEFHWVRLGDITDSGYHTLAGLHGVQKIVIPSGQHLRDGDKVTAVPEAL